MASEPQVSFLPEQRDQISRRQSGSVRRESVTVDVHHLALTPDRQSVLSVYRSLARYGDTETSDEVVASTCRRQGSAAGRAPSASVVPEQPLPNWRARRRME